MTLLETDYRLYTTFHLLDTSGTETHVLALYCTWPAAGGVSPCPQALAPAGQSGARADVQLPTHVHTSCSQDPSLHSLSAAHVPPDPPHTSSQMT